MQNSPTNEFDAQSAKWDAMGRLGIVAVLPALAFIGLVFKYAWTQFEATAPLLFFFFVLCIVVLISGSIYGLFRHMHTMSNLKAERFKIETVKFAPDFQGNYAAYLDLANQTFVQAAPGNMQVLVPQTYSPHITYHNEVEQIPGQGQTSAQEQFYQQPDLQTIIEELAFNRLEFAFGSDPQTGQLVKTNLLKAVHMQAVGGTGQGKSSQGTSILTQLCTRNDEAHLQMALLDCEGATSAPFWGLPHVRYLADEPKEAARILRSLVKEMERRPATPLTLPVILVFVEEFLNLRRTMPVDVRDQALNDYTSLALMGRKRGIFLFSIGQTSYSEKLIRDAQLQFFSSMAFAIKPSAARSAGFQNTELLNQLYSERRPGQFLLERSAGDALLLAPFVDQHTVSRLLAPASSSASSSTSYPASIDKVIEADAKPETKPTEPAYDARSQHIRDMLKQGVSSRQIIQDVWGVSGGAGYTKASQELSKIVATFF